jgi:hypothetical protein
MSKRSSDTSPFDREALLHLYGSEAAVRDIMSVCLDETRRLLPVAYEIERAGDRARMAEWLHHVLGGIAMVATASTVKKGRLLEKMFAAEYQSEVVLPERLIDELWQLADDMEAFIATLSG